MSVIPVAAPAAQLGASAPLAVVVDQVPTHGIGHLFLRVVTIEHMVPGAVDAYGNTPNAHISTTITRGLLQPMSETEVLQTQETYRTFEHLLLPAGTAITAADRVLIDSDTYEVVEVLRLFNLRQNVEHHVRCKVLLEVG